MRSLLYYFPTHLGVRCNATRLYVRSLSTYIQHLLFFQAVQDAKCPTVSYTLSRTQAVVVEYEQDEQTDMYQVGVTCNIL